MRRQEYRNSLEKSSVYGVNEFSDLTVEEFRSTVLLYFHISPDHAIIVGQYLSGLQPSEVAVSKAGRPMDVNIPQKFDW